MVEAPDGRTVAEEIVYSPWRHGVSRKDGDLIFLTDNRVLVDNVRDVLPIQCEQRRARKCVPTEADFIAANILGFGDEIGAVTNRITAQTELQSLFDPESPEYNELQYRITAGQHLQQNVIDM